MITELILLGLAGQLMSILREFMVLQRGMNKPSPLTTVKMYFALNWGYNILSVVLIVLFSYLLSQSDAGWLLEQFTTFDGTLAIQFKITIIVCGYVGANLLEAIRKIKNPIKLIIKDGSNENNTAGN